MKGIVVYDTSYGNTRIIAETIVGTLRESGIDAELSYVKDVKKPSAAAYDFWVLGSPTKFGTMSFAFRGFLGKFNGEEWASKPFAAFDTELPDNVEHKEWSAAEKIALKLVEKKMSQLLPVLKTVVLGNKGPLRKGEIDRTKDYAKQLTAKLKQSPV